MATTYNIELKSAYKTALAKQLYPKEDISSSESGDESYEEDSRSQLVKLIREVIKQEKLPVRSCFLKDSNCCFWQSLFVLPFGDDGGQPKKYKYPEDVDVLHGSYLLCKFPEVRIKKEAANDYRIAWRKYSCFNMIQNGVIKTVKGQITWFDNYTVLFLHSYERDPELTDKLEIDAGNDPSMTTWSTSLKEKQLCCPLYCFYANGPENGFYIFRLKDKQAQHEFVFSNLIVNNLSMRKYDHDSEKWVNIPPQLNLLEGLPSDNKLIDPQLYGKFSRNTPSEKKTVYEQEDVLVIDDIVRADSDNKVGFGETFVVSLKTNGRLLRCIYGAVENMTAVANGVSFNFTDNAEDPDKGETPIESIFIYFGDKNTRKLGPFDIAHFNSAFAEHFKSTPIIKGTFAIPFDFASGIKKGVGSGYVPDHCDAKIAVKLRDKRPGEVDCKFDLILRLKIAKTFTIDDDGSLRFK